MTRTLIALLLGGVLLVALPVFAQVSIPGSSALTISANPAYPGPNAAVQLTALSPLLDLQDSTIQWSVNGKVAGTGQSISVTLGGLGTQTNVSVSVSGKSGNDSTQVTLVPTSIDLLWEADSYVPPFYEGRALPGSGSSIRVLAVPHFVDANGVSIPSSTIQFTWKLNGAVDKAQSGVGEASAVFPAAILYDSDQIDVVARTTDGSLSGEAGVNVRTQGPQLVLYEDSPLFGVMYRNAISQTSTASESETSFAAVPYFAAALSANDPSLAYQWTVNSASVAADPQDPSEITISAQTSGVASIGLSVSKPSDPFFSASGSWQVSFNGAGASANNVFHGSSTQ